MFQLPLQVKGFRGNIYTRFREYKRGGFVYWRAVSSVVLAFAVNEILALENVVADDDGLEPSRDKVGYVLFRYDYLVIFVAFL